MKKIPAVLLVVALSWCVSSIAMSETDEQGVKGKNVAKMVKQQSSNEKMMPAPEVQLKRLARGLQLSAEQQKQIRPMLKDEYAMLKEIRQNEDLSPKQIRTKVEVLRAETVAKIQTVLTPEQKENYDMISSEIKSNKQMRMQENRKERIGTKAEPPPQQPKQ